MNKEDIDVLARYLTDMKDLLKELEMAVKKKDEERISSAKRRLLSLQNQVSKRI